MKKKLCGLKKAYQIQGILEYLKKRKKIKETQIQRNPTKSKEILRNYKIIENPRTHRESHESQINPKESLKNGSAKNCCISKAS